MAHHKSALKRIRTSEKARIVNRRYRTRMRDAVKALLSSENKETGEKNLKTVYSLLDKLVIKGILHKNKAANQKSRLTKFVSGLK